MSRVQPFAIHGRSPAWGRLPLATFFALSMLLSGCGSDPDAGTVSDERFDPPSALKGVNFDPATTDGNGPMNGHNTSGNGIPDADEMALIAAVINDPATDHTATGGVSQVEVKAAWTRFTGNTRTDLAGLIDRFPTAPHMVTGYLMIGTPDSIATIRHMVEMFGAPLRGDYSEARGLEKWFGPDGDADGDGVKNRAEHAAAIANGSSYVDAALDPAIREAGTPRGTNIAVATKKTVGILLYPGFEVLDVFGPVEMWSYVPDFQLVYIAEKAGPVKSFQGIEVIADRGFGDAPAIDILMVPGGFGTTPALENRAILDYIRDVHATSELTTSVCSGSALLARAGVLDELKATSNKRFFSLAATQSDQVDWVVPSRWVEDGKVFTSSGVSAGIDMALAVVARLHGIEAARSIASGVEYQWHEAAGEDPFARYADWPPKQP